LTHSLKAPGFDPSTYKVKTWFQACAFKCKLQRRYSEVAALARLDCDRPYLAMSWIQSLIILRAETPEGLRVPPPILSRVHQVLSDGLLGRAAHLS
jgi:hypothetical protein